MVVLLSTEGKKPMMLAEVCCNAAQSLGITTLNLVERSMTPKTEETVKELYFWQQHHNVSIAGFFFPTVYNYSSSLILY